LGYSTPARKLIDKSPLPAAFRLSLSTMDALIKIGPAVREWPREAKCSSAIQCASSDDGSIIRRTLSAPPPPNGFREAYGVRAACRRFGEDSAASTAPKSFGALQTLRAVRVSSFGLRVRFCWYGVAAKLRSGTSCPPGPRGRSRQHLPEACGSLRKVTEAKNCFSLTYNNQPRLGRSDTGIRPEKS